MSQIFYKTYYHLVWSTKDRQPVINNDAEEILRKIIPGKIDELGGILQAINMVEDHIHLLVSIPPKISISELVKSIKGCTSFFINSKYPDHDFYWQPGFSVHTLSKTGVENVTNYINTQKERHQSGDLIEALEPVSE